MYDKHPYVSVSESAKDCYVGWDAIGGALGSVREDDLRVVCIECYPGVFEGEVKEQFIEMLGPQFIIETKDLFLDSDELNRRIAPMLTDDPVFGVMSKFEILDFFDSEKLSVACRNLREVGPGLSLVIGTGSVEVASDYDVLIYADLARWEIQKRQRTGRIGNLGAKNQTDSAAQKYKRAFFLDWRAADKFKQHLMPHIDYLLDTNNSSAPKMISGDVMRRGMQIALARPFRVVPFFDPGPWGGHWMESAFDLPRDAPNYAWCFDCVPEENSLLLGFGDERVEIPAINLVLFHPEELLGPAIYKRFGTEFPIRFDLLDTMGGGNLSLQVHPMTSYVREHFGIGYTQDESYYMLDAASDARVYLGLRDGIEPDEMTHDLERAQHDGQPFDVDKYVNQWLAKKHDHFLIPAGTVHCSGRDGMVLEISATPYIFTFKLWDWGRLGLDGKPRPIHLDRGIENIQWDRTTDWVKESLINRFEQIAAGEGWREERTGLHSLQFIETRRHWFTDSVLHDTCGTVNVLSLVEGAEIVVESPTNAFLPFVVHYAETFIVPAQVGSYSIRPHGSAESAQCATLKAFVRSEL